VPVHALVGTGVDADGHRQVTCFSPDVAFGDHHNAALRHLANTLLSKGE